MKERLQEIGNALAKGHANLAVALVIEGLMEIEDEEEKYELWCEERELEAEEELRALEESAHVPW